MLPRHLAALVLLALLAPAPACDRHDDAAPGAAAPAPSAGPIDPLAGDPDDPPSAQRSIVAALREDEAAERHPGDGGGRAWLEGPASATALEPGRWTVVYETGPLGIAEGGSLYFMTSPFWGWSTPQTEAPDLHGYTEVTSDAEGVTLESATIDAQLLAVRVGGRALAAGERVRFVFGAGPELAGGDRFAERGEHFWLSVDADGDGVRATLESSPALDFAAGPPERLVLTLPSTARPGARVRLVAAVLDREGSTGAPFVGEVTLAPLPAGLRGPASVRFEPSDGGRSSVELRVEAPGTWRVSGRAGEMAAESNPLVAGDEPRILWADLHGHSNFSDGTGTPEDWYRYARDVAGLDVAALTDHDHWGVRFLDRHPELWEEIGQQVRAFYEPGRFVALLGYEWTSWIHGHRHVLYFDGTGEVHSSIDEATDDPRELWAALAGRPALTFAHHSAGGPIPTNWAIPPDPVLEPLTEIVSVHGSSEAADSPGAIYSPLPGNYVRDVLDHGFRLGFVGSGDGHDGHPGLAHLASVSGGVAAILAEEATREAVLAALRARRTYATNGPRIVLRVSLGPRTMGSLVPHAEVSGGALLRVGVVAPGEISRVELVRSGRIAASWPGGGSREFAHESDVEDLAAGEYLYVRVVQIGGGAAWSSPIFID